MSSIAERTIPFISQADQSALRTGSPPLKPYQLCPNDEKCNGALLDLLAAGNNPLPRLDLKGALRVIFLQRSPDAAPVDKATFGLAPDAPVRLFNLWDREMLELYHPLYRAITELHHAPAALEALLDWTERNVFNLKPPTALPVLDLSCVAECKRLNYMIEALAARGLRVLFIAKLTWLFVPSTDCRVLQASAQPDSPYVFVQRILASCASPEDQRRVLDCWLDREPHLKLDGTTLGGLPLDHPLIAHALITTHGGTLVLRSPNAGAAPAHQPGAKTLPVATPRVAMTPIVALAVVTRPAGRPPVPTPRLAKPEVSIGDAATIEREATSGYSPKSVVTDVDEAAEVEALAAIEAPDCVALQPYVAPNPPAGRLRRLLDAFVAWVCWLLSACVRPLRSILAHPQANTTR